MTVRPRNPPRDELPCAVPNPSHSITFRVHCPSKAVVFMTTIPRFRPYHAMGMMQRCQKAQMQGCFAAQIRSTFALPRTSNRSVGPRILIML